MHIRICGKNTSDTISRHNQSYLTDGGVGGGMELSANDSDVLFCQTC